MSVLMDKIVSIRLTNGETFEGTITGSLIGASNELVGWWVTNAVKRRILVPITSIVVMEDMGWADPERIS